MDYSKQGGKKELKKDDKCQDVHKMLLLPNYEIFKCVMLS